MRKNAAAMLIAILVMLHLRRKPSASRAPISAPETVSPGIKPSVRRGNVMMFGVECATDDIGQPKPCYGCAHAASAHMHTADGKRDTSSDFPGRPSGERPCFFCVRNVNREQWIADLTKREGGKVHPDHPCHGRWYDSSHAVRCPMDCYQPLDMVEQVQAWIHAERAGVEAIMSLDEIAKKGPRLAK